MTNEMDAIEAYLTTNKIVITDITAREVISHITNIPASELGFDPEPDIVYATNDLRDNINELHSSDQYQFDYVYGNVMCFEHEQRGAAMNRYIDLYALNGSREAPTNHSTVAMHIIDEDSLNAVLENMGIPGIVTIGVVNSDNDLAALVTEDMGMTPLPIQPNMNGIVYPSVYLPGTGSDHEGRIAIIVCDRLQRHGITDTARQILNHLRDLRADPPVTNELAIPYREAFIAAKSEYVMLSESLVKSREEVAEREMKAKELITTYAAMRRLNEDENRRISKLPPMMQSLAFQQARLGSGTLASMQNDRRIKTCSFVNNIIEFRTHKYGMPVRWCHECCEDSCECIEEGYDYVTNTIVTIPEIDYRINVSNGFDYDAITITSPEHPQRMPHPHVNEMGKPCLGNSSTALAEIWARRDWESMVSVLLAWHAIYNPYDPYVTGEEMEDHFGWCDRGQGWFAPEQEAQPPEDLTLLSDAEVEATLNSPSVLSEEEVTA